MITANPENWPGPILRGSHSRRAKGTGQWQPCCGTHKLPVRAAFGGNR